MKDNKAKKEILAQYKERKIVGGVYAIKNMLNNRLLICATTELHHSKNRFEFSQKTGSCVDLKLQSDWDKLGGDQFAFEVLDELKKDDTQTIEEYKAEIDLLKEVWIEKLADSDFY